jgi:hypothetical protein
VTLPWSGRRHRAAPVVLWLAAAAAGAAGPGARAGGAEADNDVEWNGVFSHPSWRLPVQPEKNQAWTLELRVFRGDITGARVRTWDGAERFHVNDADNVLALQRWTGAVRRPSTTGRPAVS